MPEGEYVLAAEARLKDFISANVLVMNQNLLAFQKTVNSVAATTGKSFEQTNSAVTALKGGLETIGKIAVGFVGFQALKGQVTACFKAFAESEQTIIQLKNSLRNVGYTTEESYNKFERMAQVIAQTTTFTDEAARSAETYLVSIAGLNEEGVQRIMPVLADFATRFGMDMSQAAFLFSKALDGNTAALGRYGIQLKDIKDPVERFNELIKQGAVYQGEAGAEMDTVIGRYKNMRKAIDELQETFGSFFATLEAKLGLMSKISSSLQWWTAALQNFSLGKANLEPGEDAWGAWGESIGESIGAAKSGKGAKTANPYNPGAGPPGGGGPSEYMKSRLANEKRIKEEMDKYLDEMRSGKVEDFSNVPFMQEIDKEKKYWEDYYKNLEKLDREAMVDTWVASLEQRGKALKDQLDKEKELVKTAFTVAGTGMELYTTLFKAQSDRRIDSINKERDVQLAALDKSENARELAKRREDVRRSGDSISAKKLALAEITREEQLAAARQRINEDAIKKEKGIREQQRKFDMASAVIKGALASASAIANPPGPPLSLLTNLPATVAATAVQIAAIGSQRFARGTRYAPGGWSLVGEEGPEAMYLPRGSQIYTHNETKNMMGGNITVHLHGASITSRDVVDAIRQAKRNGELATYGINI